MTKLDSDTFARPRARRPRLLASVALALLAIPFAACISSQSDRGVEPAWHDVEPEAFERGRTTRAEVLELLGPPSQILSLSQGTALYYLLESSQSKGLVLLLYNQRKERTRYDRAVFFFDDREVLTEYSLSSPTE